MAEPLPSAPWRVLLAGAGRVGTAVAELLRRRGHDIVGVYSRTPGSTRRASDLLGAPVVPLDRLPHCDLLLIGVADPVIEWLAHKLAPVVPPGTIVCHFAGSFGVQPLAPLAERGARPCTLHPVQACPDIERALERLPGSAWGITCGRELRQWAKTLVASELGGLPVEVSEPDRPLWHAAAVVTSNATAALLATGEAILSSIGIERPERVLGPLAGGTIANAMEAGGGAATLTGPAVRGETETIERHLRNLEREAPDLLPGYLAATRLLLWSARHAGRLDAPTHRAMVEFLDAR